VENTWSDTQSVHEQIGPRLRPNDLIETTDHPLRSIVQVTRGHGFTQYGGMMFPMRTMFHIDPETYRQRQAAQWPIVGAHPGTITIPLNPALFGEKKKPLKPPSRSPGLDDDRAMLELEKTLDTYQGVRNDDEVKPKLQP